MTDPKRWSDAGDCATDIEQLLVRGGQAWPMPSAQKLAVWGQIQHALPPTPALPDPAGQASLLALPTVKALCLLVALSGLVGGGYHVFAKRHAASPSDDLPVVTSVSVMPPVVEPPGAEPSSSATPEASTPAPVASHAAPPSRASQLREESLTVIAARQALRDGDAKGALRLLELARQRFRLGSLLEEREALTIQALAKSGNKALAASRAQAFINSHPRSPHAADVQRYVAE